MTQRSLLLRQASALALCTALAMAASDALAAPQGGVVTRGGTDVSISQGGANTQITTAGNGKYVIDWTSFNVAQGEQVDFHSMGQNPGQGAVLNRIPASAGVTSIDGAITGNTGVFLFSPGGLLFGPHAVVNLPAFVASTGTLTDADVANLSDTDSNVNWSPAVNATATTITVQNGAEIHTTGLTLLQAQSIEQGGKITPQACQFGCPGHGAVIYTTQEGGGVSWQEGSDYQSANHFGSAPRTASSIVQTATGETRASEGVIIRAPVTSGTPFQSAINLSGVVEVDQAVEGARPEISLTAQSIDTTSATLTATANDGSGSGQVYVEGAGAFGDITTDQFNITLGYHNSAFAKDVTLNGALITNGATSIGVEGDLTVNGTIKPNAGEDGGPIHLYSPGTLTINGGLTSDSTVTLNGHDIVLGPGATVTADANGEAGGANAPLSLYAEGSITAAATSTLSDGTRGNSTDINVFAGYGDGDDAGGNVKLGNVSADILNIQAPAGTLSPGDLEFAGSTDVGSYDFAAGRDLIVSGSLTNFGQFQASRDFIVSGTVSGPALDLAAQRDFVVTATGLIQGTTSTSVQAVRNVAIAPAGQTRTDDGSLTLKAGTGGSGDLSAGKMSAAAIVVSAPGSVTLGGDAYGGESLQATAGSDLAVNARIGAGDAITLGIGRNLTLGAAGEIDAPGDLTLSVPDSITADTASLIKAGGALTIQGGLGHGRGTSAYGDVTLGRVQAAGGALTIGTQGSQAVGIETGQTQQLGGRITLNGAASSTGAIDVRSTVFPSTVSVNANVTSTGAAARATFIGQTITVGPGVTVSAAGVVMTAQGDLIADATSVLKAGDSDGVYAAAGAGGEGQLTVGRATGGVVQLKTTGLGGEGGGILVGGAVTSTQGAITITSSGGGDATSIGQALNARTDAVITSSGDLVVQSTGSVTAGGGASLSSAAGHDMTLNGTVAPAGGNGLSLSIGRDLYVGGTTTLYSPGALDIEVPGSIYAGPDSIIRADGASLTIRAGVGTGNYGDITLGSANVNGALTISAQSGYPTTTAPPGGYVARQGSLSDTGGAITIAKNASGQSTVDIRSTGVAPSTVTLNGFLGAGQATVVGQTVVLGPSFNSIGGPAAFTAIGDFRADAASQISSSGAVSITAGTGPAGGDLATGRISAGSVTLATAGGAQNGKLTLAGAINAGSGAVLVSSTGGGGALITASTFGATSVQIATAGALTISAPGSVSSGGAVALTSGGAFSLESGASIATYTAGPSAIWPAFADNGVGVRIAAPAVNIAGTINADNGQADVGIASLQPSGTSVVGGAATSSTGFELDSGEIARITARILAITAGRGEGDDGGLTTSDLLVRDLAVPNSIARLALGAESGHSLTVSGAVTAASTAEIDLGFVRDTGAALFGLLPGTVIVNGSLGGAGSPIGALNLIARHDILIGTSAFTGAAAADPNFDAVAGSSTYAPSSTGALALSAKALQLAAQGRMVQQNTSPGTGTTGFSAAVPQDGVALIAAPDFSKPIGGPNGWTPAYAAGPTSTQLYGVLTNADGAVTVTGSSVVTTPGLFAASIKPTSADRINDYDDFGTYSGPPVTPPPEPTPTPPEPTPPTPTPPPPTPPEPPPPPPEPTPPTPPPPDMTPPEPAPPPPVQTPSEIVAASLPPGDLQSGTAPRSETPVNATGGSPAFLVDLAPAASGPAQPSDPDDPEAAAAAAASSSADAVTPNGGPSVFPTQAPPRPSGPFSDAPITGAAPSDLWRGVAPAAATPPAPAGGSR